MQRPPPLTRVIGLSLKPIIKTFQINFGLGSIPNGFSPTESREVSLNGNVYDFSI